MLRDKNQFHKHVGFLKFVNQISKCTRHVSLKHSIKDNTDIRLANTGRGEKLWRTELLSVWEGFVIKATSNVHLGITALMDPFITKWFLMIEIPSMRGSSPNRSQ